MAVHHGWSNGRWGWGSIKLHNELGDPALQEWETRGVVPVLQERAEELVRLQGADAGVGGRFRAMFHQNGLGKGIHMRVQR